MQTSGKRFELAVRGDQKKSRRLLEPLAATSGLAASSLVAALNRAAFSLAVASSFAASSNLAASRSHLAATHTTLAATSPRQLRRIDVTLYQTLSPDHGSDPWLRHRVRLLSPLFAKSTRATENISIYYVWFVSARHGQ